MNAPRAFWGFGAITRGGRIARAAQVGSLGVWLCAGCASSQADAKSPDSEQSEAAQGGEAKEAPELTFTSFDDGEEFTLQSLQGQVVFLDIWASWCAPCKEEMPILDEIAKKYADKDVTILAVSIDADKEDAVEFFEERDDWTLRLAHDPQGGIGDALELRKMPSSYVIDRSGRIRFMNAGFRREDAAQFERQLDELLDE